MSSPRLVPLVALAAAALVVPASASATISPYSSVPAPDPAYGSHTDDFGNPATNWTSDNILGPNEDLNISFPFLDDGMDGNGGSLTFNGGTGLLSRTDDSDVSIITTTRQFGASQSGLATNAPSGGGNGFYQLHTGSSLVCGTSVALKLDMSSVSQSQFNQSYNFKLPTGVHGAYHRSDSTAVGQVVMDGQTIESPVTVSHDGLAKGMRVRIGSLEHRFSTYWLKITLVSPSGKKVVLMDHQGSLDANTAARPKTLSNVVFSDGAVNGQVPEDPGEALADNYTNIVMQPKESLSAFDGEPLSGDWKLQVQDIAQDLQNRSSRGRGYGFTGSEMAQLGDWGLDTSHAVCNGTPEAWFGGSDPLVLNPAGATLDASASFDPSLGGSIASYKWDLNGDGTLETTTASPTVSYPAVSSSPYSRDIKLAVVDNNGNQSATITRTAIFSNKPVVSSVTLSPTNPMAGTEVTLTAAATDSDGDGLTYSWDLNGDGVYGDVSGTNPKYTWDTSGPQIIRLKVTDSRGASTYYWQTISIANTNPVARMTYTPLPAVVGQQVTLDGSTSTDADGTVVKYAWDLDGNGTIDDVVGTSPTTTYTFQSAGEHIVRLVVTDNTGGTNEVDIPVWVTGAPVGSITATPNPPLVNESVTFSAAASHDSDPGGSITKYEWDLDGNGSYEVSGPSAVSASKSYPNAGTVSIRLRLTDNDGATSVTVFALTVKSNAPAPTPTPVPTPTPTPKPGTGGGSTGDPGTKAPDVTVPGGPTIKAPEVEDPTLTEDTNWWDIEDDTEHPSKTLDGFAAELGAAAKQKAKKAYKAGIVVKLTVSAAGKVAVKATVDGKSAKKYGLVSKPQVLSIGAGVMTFKKGGAVKFSVKFNKKYAAKLKKVKSLPLMLRGLVTSSDGTKLAVSKKVTIVK